MRNEGTPINPAPVFVLTLSLLMCKYNRWKCSHNGSYPPRKFRQCGAQWWKLNRILSVPLEEGTVWWKVSELCNQELHPLPVPISVKYFIQQVPRWNYKKKVIRLAETLYYLRNFSSSTVTKNSSILSRYTAIVPILSGKIVKGNILFFNLLKPTGHVMYQQFNIQLLYALPTLYLGVLYLSENKQRLVPLTS